MWEEIYEKHHTELRRYAAAACGSEAEDAVQEVFLKAMQNEPLFEELGPSQRRAWLYRALKNELCDRYRRQKLEETYPQGRQEEGFQDPGIQEAENRLLLAMLTPQDRVLFHLRYEQGYTAAELAEMYQLPAGTVRSRLSRCRQILKLELK